VYRLYIAFIVDIFEYGCDVRVIERNAAGNHNDSGVGVSKAAKTIRA